MLVLRASALKWSLVHGVKMIGRRVTFQKLVSGGQWVEDDGTFLAWGIRAATEEGSYSRALSSYSCALIEDDFGYVHSVEIDRFKFASGKTSQAPLP